jgi:sterol desaturase/sphingolipid hydroxylase (fatty acid hydroxylase superfamily)
VGLFINPVGVLILAVSCMALERWRPLRTQPVRREGLRTDLLHLFVTHTLEVVLAVLVVGAVIGLARRAQLPPLVAVVASQSRTVQAIEALLIADFVGYLWHRFEHRGGVWWRLHAVHHSSVQLDWLASARRHPLGTAIGRAVAALPLVLLGFPVDVLSGVAGLLTLWAILLHANARFPLRFARRIIATPEFHQRHHALADGPGVNFAGLFPLWDLVGGTYADDVADRFGCDAPVPKGYLAQLRFPLARAQKRPTAEP